ncbi:MAG TPA: hypothetical protein VFK88_14460 [Gallionella sp.]|nr:hypothetical protein [Gallionella sp.]
MSCILRAWGQHFDVDAFMQHSTLIVDSCWRTGERRFPKRAADNFLNKINESSGIRVVASEAGFSELEQQMDDATSFLRNNYEGVLELASFRDVEGIVLDFGAEIYPPGWSSFAFPAELVALAGSARISLGLSVYPTDNEEDANG